MVGELPLTITLPGVYHMISDPMLSFQSICVFLTLLGVLLLNKVVAQSVGFFGGACCLDLQVSITASALYALATAVPPWLAWARYASMVPYRYSSSMLAGLYCARSRASSPSARTARRIRVEAQGGASDQVLPLWANTAMLLAFLIVFRTMGYLVPRYCRVPK